MNMRNTLLPVLFFCIAISVSFADANEHHHASTIEDLKTQLAGTSWKATSTKPLRPGLAPILTFTDTTVAPAGYRYDVNAANSLTIHFNHGDTQLMLLASDGHHLKLVFQGHNYTYQLVGH